MKNLTALDAADEVSSATAPHILHKEPPAAWCIVPVERSNRNPEQRAEMPGRFQLKKLGYDYRAAAGPQPFDLSCKTPPRAKPPANR